MKTHWVVCLYVEDLTPARSTLLSCSTAPRQVDEVLVPSGALHFPDHSKPKPNNYNNQVQAADWCVDSHKPSRWKQATCHTWARPKAQTYAAMQQLDSTQIVHTHTAWTLCNALCNKAGQKDVQRVQQQTVLQAGGQAMATRPPRQTSKTAKPNAGVPNSIGLPINLVVQPNETSERAGRSHLATGIRSVDSML